MQNGFKIIDSDMHIMEPLDLWEKYIDPRFDNLVFSSDYPHSDSDFPKATQEFFHREMPAASRRKIFWDNCVKFYGIDA